MENLFDLSKLDSQFRGYFVDAEGKVYSNKLGFFRALKPSAPKTAATSIGILALMAERKLFALIASLGSWASTTNIVALPKLPKLLKPPKSLPL